MNQGAKPQRLSINQEPSAALAGLILRGNRLSKKTKFSNSMRDPDGNLFALARRPRDHIRRLLLLGRRGLLGTVTNVLIIAGPFKRL
jgi:hypothetical protein